MSDSEVNELLMKYNKSSESPVTLVKDGVEYTLTEGRIKDLTHEFIELCADEAIYRKDFGMNSKVVDMLINIKKVWWPATQKSVVGHVEDFDKKMKAWYVLQKDLLDKADKDKDLKVDAIKNADR